MRSVTIVAALTLALVPADPIAQTCTPGTSVARQFRTAMKHRAPGGDGTTVSVAEVLSWRPPGGVARDDVRARDSAIDAREDRSFTVEGELWRVKVEDNDCDLHLELTAPGGGVNAPRVIAEVPAGSGYEAARAVVLAAVRRPDARSGDRVDLTAPVRVRLTGYAFWDGAHWCRRSAARGCSHGTAAVATLWELHPVWRVEVLSRTPAPGGALPQPSPPTRVNGPARRVVCNDGWTSPCACGHPPRMHCCRGHRGESRGCDP